MKLPSLRQMGPIKNIIPYLLYLALGLWALNDMFFWDSVQLGAKHAYFYFDNGLKFQFLPEEINSGHLPVFGYYLALTWSVFGKSLIVSHLAMFPFVIGIVYFMTGLAKLRFKGPLLFLSILVLLSDPTLVSQVGMLGPDVPLICFFLASLYFHQKSKLKSKSIFLLLLAMISMRGMFLVFAFFLFELFVEKRSWKDLFKMYLPAVLVTSVFFILHFISQGWIGFHSDSPWSESFATDGMRSFISILKKPVVILWRLLDFNRWFIFLVAFVFAFKMFRANKKLYLITSELYLLGIITVIFGLLGTMFSGLTAHRYFLPINILVSFYFLRLVSLSELTENSKKIVLVSAILILNLGHLLIYPAHIDQGWDASLAHKPYLSLRPQVDMYLAENGISKMQVCTSFPDHSAGKFYYLDDDMSSYSRLSSNECEYFLLSNVHNEIEPADMEGHTLIKEWKKFGVWYRLLKFEIIIKKE